MSKWQSIIEFYTSPEVEIVSFPNSKIQNSDPALLVLELCPG